MAPCFKPLHPTAFIVFGDVRLGCTCSIMETHFMKLSMLLEGHTKFGGLYQKVGDLCTLCTWWTCAVISHKIPFRGRVAVIPNHLDFFLKSPDCRIFTSEKILWLDLKIGILLWYHAEIYWALTVTHPFTNFYTSSLYT